MTPDCETDLVLDYDLDAPPERVWRAISVAEIRERWLPRDALADPIPIDTIPGREVRYRMTEKLPPFLESVVRFQVAPDGNGGTRLTIVHELSLERPRALPRAGNGNVMSLRMAA